jgi:hypothetical protein
MRIIIENFAKQVRKFGSASPIIAGRKRLAKSSLEKKAVITVKKEKNK